MNDKKNIITLVAAVVLVSGGAYYMSHGKQLSESTPIAAAGGMGGVKEEGDASDLAETDTPADANKLDSSEKKAIRTMDIQGMKVEVLHEGEGAGIKSGQMAAMHYVGKFTDGKVFDTSLRDGDKSQPFVFKLGAGMVIKGWDLGVEGMKVGEARRFTIPSELAYGDTGTPGGPIPPKATLVFDVQLMGMK